MDGGVSMTQFNGKELLDALYQGVLDRQADRSGLEFWLGRLDAGAITIEQVVRGFLASEEYQQRIAGQGAPARFTNDVSQYGETFDLLKLWVNEYSANRWVVDVGARGKERSNSYDLMKHFGWKGILIEANPQLIPAIQSEFAGLDADIVNFAVSNFEGTATLSLGVNDDISSLTEANTEAWGALRGSIDVEVRRLENLLDERNAPYDFELLSLDIEGEDIKVLNGLLANSAYRPRWIIIEASHNFSVRSLDDLEFSQDVKDHYEIRGQSVANLILGRRDRTIAAAPGAQ